MAFSTSTQGEFSHQKQFQPQQQPLPQRTSSEAVTLKSNALTVSTAPSTESNINVTRTMVTAIARRYLRFHLHHKPPYLHNNKHWHCSNSNAPCTQERSTIGNRSIGHTAEGETPQQEPSKPNIYSEKNAKKENEKSNTSSRKAEWQVQVRATVKSQPKAKPLRLGQLVQRVIMKRKV